MLDGGAGCGGRGGVCEALGMHIGVLGGTGPAGRGIATRLAATGHRVTLGSRDRERAAQVVDELRARWGDRVDGLEPGSNHDAAAADLVVLATVWDAAVPTAQAHADQLAGKIVISMANGLEKRGRQFVPVPSPAGSIAAEVKAAAPGGVRGRRLPPRPGRRARRHQPAAHRRRARRRRRRGPHDRPRPRRRHPRPPRPSTPVRSRTRSASRPSRPRCSPSTSATRARDRSASKASDPAGHDQPL